MFCKYISLTILLLVLSISFVGCKRADFAENQAYAVMLGVDMDDSKDIKLTLRYPMLAASSGGSEGGDKSSYSSGSATGMSFQQALESLKTTVPREINLSALTMVIVSEDVIKADKLDQVLDSLTRNYRMYSSAYIAICDGNAGEFIENQEPIIGSRLSEGLKAMTENLDKLGYIAGSLLSDVYYRTDSIYSEPMIMLCQFSESPESKSESKKTNIYEGVAVINDNNELLKLNKKQTLLANLIAGEIENFIYTNDDIAVSLTADKKPAIKISSNDDLKIDIELNLSGAAMADGVSMTDTARLLREDIMALIELCKISGVEPFGFADKAASKFLTIDQWQEYDWHEKFAGCTVNVDISIKELF